MCGIFGEFVFKGSLTEKEQFFSLLKKSRKRGPDSEGYFSNEKNIRLGFNRLAILDLTANANQPIHSPSKRYSMVFNGEIYNYLELRNTLPDGKYHFAGHGDTESIIACFDHYGITQTVGMLDGMFAIGIFDHNTDSLHLIRDFAGIKPLHYGIDSGKVVFASQYDQISEHPAFVSNSIQPEILRLYLEQHFIPAPYGILENTYQVMPGEIVSFSIEGEKKTHKYWEFPDRREFIISSADEAIEKMEDELKKSVKSELVSDVPIGSFLSGGIDSPLICFVAQEILQGKLDTFSIGSDSQIHDESKDAQEFADMIKSNHNSEKMVSKNAAMMLNDAMDSLSEPFADYSLIPTFQISKNAKKKVTVALSGDGGDELFFGYERFWSILKNRFIQKFPYPVKYFIYGTDKILTGNRWLNSGALSATSSESHCGSHSRFSQNWISAIAPELTAIHVPSSWDTYLYPHSISKRKLAMSIQKAEFYGMMQKTLFKVDRASMANSLEVRIPFLKKNMIETALMLDPWLHLKGKKRKKLLKDLARKKYPDKQISDIKRGFSVPLAAWIREELKEPIGDVLLNHIHADAFGMQYNMIEKMFNDHLEEKGNYQWPLFTIYSLFKWNESRKR